MNKKISVIIPAFNEEGTIETVIQKTYQMFLSNNYTGEIIIVNDCSKDKTGEMCEKISRGRDEVKVIHNKKNLGKTNAIKKGLKISKGDIIVTIDADLQYDPFDVPKLLQCFDTNVDVVSGYRMCRKDNLIRKIFSYFFNLYNRILFDIQIRDINCGLKAYRREVINGIELKQSKWFIDVELLAKIAKRKASIIEVPISHYDRGKGKSKISLIFIVYETIKNSLILKFYFLKDFWKK